MNDVCRCCLSEECYKDLSTEYFWSGEREVYTDMLLNTYNIHLSEQKNIKGLICEACISRLRDASDFKKQVLVTEETILKQLEMLKDVDNLGSKITPKLELNDEFDDEISDGFSDSDFAWNLEEKEFKTEDEGQIFVIKLEPKEEKDTKNLASKRIPRNTSVNIKGRSRINTNTIKSNVGVKRKVTKSIKVKSMKNDIGSKQKCNVNPASQTQTALRENTLKLILNSNMCLFKSLKNKYGCYICKESFIKIQDLREHSKIHSNIKEISLKVNRLSGMSYKNVDISFLACKTCSEPCNALSDLKEHLENKHGLIFGNADHLLIPYKLENEFQCVICNEKFHTYLRLSIHMNKHSTSNVCEICGGSFFNRLSLRTHIHSMHKEKKCSRCSATFATNSARARHMQKSHNMGPYKRYCLICGKTFRYTYLLVEHKVLEHGEERLNYNCSECGKTFHTTQNLRIHVRSVHIKERNHPCGVCDMRFFTKCDQKRHERTHEDVRSFSCEYCEGKFKSKDSLRRHLKRQHGNLFVVQCSENCDI